MNKNLFAKFIMKSSDYLFPLHADEKQYHNIESPQWVCVEILTFTLLLLCFIKSYVFFVIHFIVLVISLSSPKWMKKTKVHTHYPSSIPWLWRTKKLGSIMHEMEGRPSSVRLTASSPSPVLAWARVLVWEQSWERVLRSLWDLGSLPMKASATGGLLCSTLFNPKPTSSRLCTTA